MKLLKKYTEQFLPYLFVFIASIFRPNDTDLGWHLKYGEYFFNHFSVLRENTFSVMMADFKWANTSWLVDVIDYITYYYLGFLGLTLLGAFVITLTFLFFSKAFKLDFFEKAIIFPILVYIEMPVNQIGFRGQLLSVLFLGILFYIIERFDSGREKIIYLTIPLFLVWANTHGQFLIGLGLFYVWILIYLIMSYFNKESGLDKFKENLKILGITGLVSFLVTLINPFGIGIYQDAFLHFGNEDLKSVAEYIPFKESTLAWWNQLIVGLLIGVGFLFIFFNGQLKKRFPMFSILGILYILSWVVRRYAWSFYYLAIPFIKPLVYFIKPDSKKYTFIVAFTLFLIYIGAVFFLKMPFSQYKDMSWRVYCEEFRNCSEKSAQFIIKNNLNKPDLMTTYDWGGWLIWNYPQIKPSIDGRMHLWIDEKGYSAFRQYYSYEQNLQDINDSSYNTIYMSPTKTIYKQLLLETKAGKWKLVYQDKYAGIFIRNK